MAPMKKNRNRDRKNVVRRRVKNPGRKSYKYSESSDDSRVDRRTKRKITGYKIETSGIRKKRKNQRMGAGRHSKLGRGRNRPSSDCESDSRDSEEVRGKRYIRDALQFGLASGYLIPVEDAGRQVLRVTSDIIKFRGTERSGSEGQPDDLSNEGQGRRGRSGQATGGKRITTAKTGKNGQKNVRKRGRSRTKSPRKPVAPKRRKKRSESRSKPKSRIQKRKWTPEAKNEQPASTRRSGTNEEGGGADDEDDEPDPDNEDDADKNSDEKNKLPVTSRPGSIVPNSDNRTNGGGEKKMGDDEPSEPSADEGSTDDEEEEEETLQNEEGLDEEDTNEVVEDTNPNGQ